MPIKGARLNTRAEIQQRLGDKGGGSTPEGSTYLGDPVTSSLDSLRKESKGSILITLSEGRASQPANGVFQRSSSEFRARARMMAE